ncbi:MAG TPA: hypothetical protein VIE37_07450 [Methylomirabilota bacterium]|jgi:hypothetical protein
MSDDPPGSGVSHTVTIEIPPKQWTPESWAKFKQEVKKLLKPYQGTITSMTFEEE